MHAYNVHLSVKASTQRRKRTELVNKRVQFIYEPGAFIFI